jgi:hypothetical protein
VEQLAKVTWFGHAAFKIEFAESVREKMPKAKVVVLKPAESFEF